MNGPLFNNVQPNPMDNNHLQQLIKDQFDQELKMRIEARLDKDHNISKSKSPAKRFKLFPYITGIAASLLVLFFYNGMQDNSTLQIDQIVFEAINTKILHPGLTKGDNNQGLSRIQAIESFNKGEYSLSLQTFGEIENRTSEDEFYQAMSHFYLTDYSAAVENLELVMNEDSSFDQEARWYTIIALWEMQDFNKAKDLLSEIRPQDWKYEEAQSLLKN